MVFGAAKPDWWCSEGLEANVTMTTSLSAYKSCLVTIGNQSRQCTQFTFADDMNTIVTEVFFHTYSFLTVEHVLTNFQVKHHNANCVRRNSTYLISYFVNVENLSFWL